MKQLPAKEMRKHAANPEDDFRHFLTKAGLSHEVHANFNKNTVYSGLYYLHGDHLGTAIYVTDENGKTSQFFLNLPFGEISAGDSPIPLKK